MDSSNLTTVIVLIVVFLVLIVLISYSLNSNDNNSEPKMITTKGFEVTNIKMIKKQVNIGQTFVNNVKASKNLLANYLNNMINLYNQLTQYLSDNNYKVRSSIQKEINHSVESTITSLSELNNDVKSFESRFDLMVYPPVDLLHPSHNSNPQHVIDKANKYARVLTDDVENVYEHIENLQNKLQKLFKYVLYDFSNDKKLKSKYSEVATLIENIFAQQYNVHQSLNVGNPNTQLEAVYNEAVQVLKNEKRSTQSKMEKLDDLNEEFKYNFYKWWKTNINEISKLKSIKKR